MFRIEVRTGRIDHGRLTVSLLRDEFHRFDVLAVSVIDLGIFYFPDWDGVEYEGTVITVVRDWEKFAQSQKCA